jgi:uncharacterized membrane protein
METENKSFMQNSNFGFNNSNDGNRPAKPNNNLPLAIVGTVLGLCSPCCIGLIVGIISIVFSTQVDSKYNAGDYYGAESAAKNAKILAFVGIGLGVIGLIYSIVMIAAGGLDAYMQQYQQYLN